MEAALPSESVPSFITACRRARRRCLAAWRVALCAALIWLPAHQALAQQSIWGATTTPGPVENDAAAVELGVKFRSDVAGTITGIRFYKYAQNTGTHVGNLWTSAGALLGTLTFANETASGWQTAS